MEYDPFTNQLGTEGNISTIMEVELFCCGIKNLLAIEHLWLLGDKTSYVWKALCHASGPVVISIMHLQSHSPLSIEK